MSVSPKKCLHTRLQRHLTSPNCSLENGLWKHFPIRLGVWRLFRFPSRKLNLYAVSLYALG